MSAIDRQAAIDAVFDCIGYMTGPPYSACSIIKRRIEALPQVLPKQWTSCINEEPNKKDNYLLFRPHFWGANKGQITVCYWNGEYWSDNYSSEVERALPVIDGMAWMPLPIAPQQKEV